MMLKPLHNYRIQIPPNILIIKIINKGNKRTQKGSKRKIKGNKRTNEGTKRELKRNKRKFKEIRGQLKELKKKAEGNKRNN